MGAINFYMQSITLLPQSRYSRQTLTLTRQVVCRSFEGIDDVVVADERYPGIPAFSFSSVPKPGLLG